MPHLHCGRLYMCMLFPHFVSTHRGDHLISALKGETWDTAAPPPPKRGLHGATKDPPQKGTLWGATGDAMGQEGTLWGNRGLRRLRRQIGDSRTSADKRGHNGGQQRTPAPPPPKRELRRLRHQRGRKRDFVASAAKEGTLSNHL
jgi:hypothetical protein